jgi:hypothetical protein
MPRRRQTDFNVSIQEPRSGYDSTNIYRIWNPVLNKDSRTRDVIFNEDVVFDGKKENPEIRLDRLQSTIQEIEEPEAEGPH